MMRALEVQDGTDLGRGIPRHGARALEATAPESPDRDWPANDMDAHLTRPAFPPGSAAWIYRPARPATTSGRANSRHWVLEFEPRAAPYVEPLMGWTGGSDTLQQVQLRFPSKEAAVAYARRQGLAFTVRDVKPARYAACAGANERAIGSGFQIPDRITEALPRDEPDLGAALLDPAAVFRTPHEVVEHPRLSRREKREILKRWEWDARLLELAATEGMEGGEPSRLEEVVKALILLETDERPDLPPPVAALAVAWPAIITRCAANDAAAVRCLAA